MWHDLDPMRPLHHRCSQSPPIRLLQAPEEHVYALLVLLRCRADLEARCLAPISSSPKDAKASVKNLGGVRCALPFTLLRHHHYNHHCLQ